MELTGALYIGSRAVSTAETICAVNPATGAETEPQFSFAGANEIAEACALADSCFDAYRETSLEARAVFLERIADEIEAVGAELTERGHIETGLPKARLEGERGRTAGQLRLFANVVRGGDWLSARIDSALPDRAPLPRPDIRSRNIPLGPVAVFGASNFPLAFSVAGGDTASALAAGCPVVVKGHPAHPGTSEIVARAILRAAEACEMPDGVFSLLHGGREAGAALVADPRIKAVGFTGSRAGGLALMDIAARRAEPIPVYAEMSSINPILLFPAALEKNAEALGEAFVGSLTMGAGQFCTNPGLLLGMEGDGLQRFTGAAGKALEKAAAQVMLTPGICAAYRANVERLDKHPRVNAIAKGGAGAGEGAVGQAALFSVSAADFLADESLSEEVFGAASLIVVCKSDDERRAVLEGLEGQLTATLHTEPEDEAAARALLPLLERKAGRILFNGWPTGVEVCHAMVHGGPFPSTSDGRTTSVGTRAIERFLRAVCYQNFPDAALPPALRRENADGLRRFEDGAWR